MTKDLSPIDPITLEVLRHAFAAVADEMNANLVRTAYSPNIKERRDCSCAVFDGRGFMVAQAESIPVHLGAMPFSVAQAIQRVSSFQPGDVIVLNDPYAGGAHLPDVTFIAPVFVNGEAIAFVANRAHHADIGGKEPGSLAGDATEIYQEGLRIPPVRLWRKGQLDQDLLDLILANVRTPQERLGDLRAQHAACATGIERMKALVCRYDSALLKEGMAAVMDYSQRRMQAEIAKLPDGSACFEDVLDDDGITNDPIPIVVSVTIRGAGQLNATLLSTLPANNGFTATIPSAEFSSAITSLIQPVPRMAAKRAPRSRPNWLCMSNTYSYPPSLTAGASAAAKPSLEYAGSSPSRTSTSLTP